MLTKIYAASEKKVLATKIKKAQKDLKNKIIFFIEQLEPTAQKYQGPLENFIKTNLVNIHNDITFYWLAKKDFEARTQEDLEIVKNYARLLFRLLESIDRLADQVTDQITYH